MELNRANGVSRACQDGNAMDFRQMETITTFFKKVFSRIVFIRVKIIVGQYCGSD